MTEALYYTIGALCAAPLVAVVIFILLSLFVAWNLSFIKDKPYKRPTVIYPFHKFFQKVFTPNMIATLEEFQRPNFCQTVDMEFVFLAYSVGAIVMMGAWPGVLLVSMYIILLRMMRFMYRTKTAIGKVVNSGKCLKDFKEEDKPKIEF